MRIRNAAVAGATALAVAFSGVAVAQEATPNYKNPKSEFYIPEENIINNDGEFDESLKPKEGASNLSSKIGDGLDKEVPTNGNNIFGDEQDPNLPGWAKLFYASGILGAIGTVIGTIIAAVNYGLNEGFIKF
ncbi:hypothetical protein [uncultured Corynebacterium sp.]|uniref:hypothetical protein n=1 Tax=uncultured Corynebacterium sp. TaxID=159447 RepID=UPI0026169A05|nr:hypothetical protein [uncultured Corynebacterium sp.]